MNPTEFKTKLPRRSLVAGAALLVAAQPAWAILGVWRRAARRTVFVAGAATAAATTAAVAESNAAANQAAADQSAAAAKQAEAAAAQAKAAQTKTPQQKLAELQSLYDQKLISAQDYQAAKTKILNQMTQ
jgi:hypothetical protein